MQHHKVLILDFGSQYTQLIARRVRELSIYCEIHPYNNPPENIKSFKAVILSGSPFSVRSEDPPHPDLSEIRGKLPLLAICYGAQYLAHFSGGEVAPSATREYGRANLSYIKSDETFFQKISEGSQVWMFTPSGIKLPKYITLDFGKLSGGNGWVLLTHSGHIEDYTNDNASMLSPEFEVYIKSKFKSMEFFTFLTNKNK